MRIHREAPLISELRPVQQFDGQLRIAAVIIDKPTACEQLRIIEPMQALERRGHDIILFSESGFMKSLTRGEMPLKDRNMLLMNRIITRTHGAFREFVQECAQNGIATVVDYDDDLTGRDRQTNPEGRAIPPLRDVSALTVTTPQLKAVMGGANKHVYVIRNAINIDAFRLGKSQRKTYPIVVGLTGSRTHSKDWEPVVPVVKRLAEGGIKFLVAGLIPDELRGAANIITPGILDWDRSTDGGDRVTYTHYAWLIGNTDITLCPVDPMDKFNWAKSPLKMFEGWSAGNAVIATGKPLPIYYEATLDEDSAWLIQDHNSQEEWSRAISTLVSDPVVRQRFIDGGQRAIYNNTLEGVTDLREQVYKVIVARLRRKVERG